jgi:hypothetical protein
MSNSQDEEIFVNVNPNDTLLAMKAMRIESKEIVDDYKKLCMRVKKFNKKYPETNENGMNAREQELNALTFNTGRYTIMVEDEDHTIEMLENNIKEVIIEDTSEPAAIIAEEPEVIIAEEPEVIIAEEPEVIEAEVEYKITLDESDDDTIDITPTKPTLNNDHQPKPSNSWFDYHDDLNKNIYKKEPDDGWIKPKSKPKTPYKKPKKNEAYVPTFIDKTFKITDKMNAEVFTESDFKDQIEIRILGADNQIEDLPKNILEKQQQGIHFICNHDSLGNEGEFKRKSPFIYRRGKTNPAFYWVGTDGYFYKPDDNGNLEISIFLNRRQAWRKPDQ